MKAINYLHGDATSPTTEGNKIIAHICNDIGGWGKGFVLAISKKWREPELEYRKWHKSGEGFSLGNIQIIKVSEDLFIANMIGQNGIKSALNDMPISYEAVRECLMKLSEKAMGLESSVHMPRIGCGLAGGKWELIEPIINETLLKNNIDVYVYDY